MKIIKLLLLILFFLMSSLFASTITLSNEEKDWLEKNRFFKIGESPNFEPLLIESKNKKLTGIIPDFYNHIAKQLGIEIEYVSDSWSNVFNQVKSSKIDAVGLMNKNIAIKNGFIPVTLPFDLNTVIYAKTGHKFKINNAKDIKNLRIAYMKDTLYIKDYLKKQKQITLVEKETTLEAFRAILNDEADVMMGLNSDNYFLIKNTMFNIKPIYTFKNLNVNAVIGINKNNKIFADILEKTIQNLDVNELTNLLSKWNWVPKEKLYINLTKEEKEYLVQHPILKVQNLTTFPPFNFYDKGKPSGYTIDYMNLMAKYLDVEIEYISNKRWSEYLSMLKENKLDIIPHIAVTDERKTFIDYTDFNHLKYTIGFATRKNNNYKTIDELKNKVIAVVDKTFLHTYFKKNFPEIKLYVGYSTKEVIEAVSIGMADVVVGSLPALNYYIHEDWISNLKIINIKDSGLTNKTELPMGVLKGNLHLKSILEKANDAIPLNQKNELKKKWMNEFHIENRRLTQNEILYLNKKKVIKMCVLPNWLPFEQIDKNGKHKGIGADLMQVVSKYIDTPIVLVPTKEWKISLENIKNKKCDILPVAMDLPSRRPNMNFTKPYVAEPFVVATSQKEFFIKDSQSLANKKIGIVKSYAFIEVLKRRNPTIKIIEVKNAYDGMKRVQTGELFGYVDIMPAVGYTIQKYGMFNLKIAGKLEFDIKLSVATRNDEPILNNIMQKALNEISDDQIRTIVGKWIAIKVEQSFDYTRLLYVIGIFLIILISILYKNRSIREINKKLSLANEEIKEQHEITESLNQYQESLLSLFDKGDAVLFKWKNDKDWSLEYVSKSIKKLIGYDKEEFLNGDIQYSSFIHKDDLSEVKNKIKISIKEELDYFNHEPYRIITKDGEEKWILDYKVTLKDSNGKISNFIGYMTDITEHIKHQDIILQQSKMASLGEMIGNISHQWRQPLSLISSVATGSKLKKEFNLLPDDEFNKNMDIINENSQYLSRTIDDFKNFVKGDTELVDFNLFGNIQSFLNVINPTRINNGIELIEDCDKDIKIEGYPNELIQSLINIFNNSKDALLNVPEDERYFFITVKKTSDCVCLYLKDNGGGIDDNVIDTVFEPYTTTKHKSKGTGLGLNITYNFIVTGMNGNIAVKNKKFTYKDKNYVGAEFKITFPLK